jgi:steroid 5-alpha reductase family enzyme
MLTMLASFLHLARSDKCSTLGRITSGNACVVSVLSIALVLLWTLRLGLFLIYRIYRMGHDSRMDTIKVSASKFFIAWTAQAVWVFVITLPVTALVSDVTAGLAGDVIKPMLVLGMTVYVMGAMIQVPADWQKLQFRLKPENKVCTSFSFNTSVHSEIV